MVVLRFEKTFVLTGRDGLARPVKTVGPFDTANKARLWMLKARGILDAAGASDAALEVLDDPDTL